MADKVAHTIYVPCQGTYRLIGDPADSSQRQTPGTLAEGLIAALGPDFLTFGFLLKTFRELADLKLRSLEDLSGIDFAQLSRYENGKAYPDPKSILALEKALGPDFSRALKISQELRANQKSGADLSPPIT